MKKILLLFVAVVMLYSCLSTKQVGSLTVVSTRNLDPSADYDLVSGYAGGKKHDLRSSRNETIEDAVDQVISGVPGGEYLQNARVYMVRGKYFAVQGDVWGLASDANVHGFSVGDHVHWTRLFRDHTGVIVDLKSSKVCSVRDDSGGDVSDVSYDDLTRID